jgi:Holliday junction DNA helicase RuvB
MSIVQAFIDGLLGRRQRETHTEILQGEQDRLLKHKIRNQYSEQQEIENLKEFLNRPTSHHISLARPENFSEYVGQNTTKDLILCAISACKHSETSFPHALFWGSAGLGKTTISYLIAKELNANLIMTSGGQLESKEELINIFKQFKPAQRNILFVDEIHSVKRKISEMLYSAMEDFRFDYTTTTNRVLSLNLPPFTLIGATTDMARILVPIRQRFQHSFHLIPYKTDEMCDIIYNFLSRLRYQNVKREIVLAIVSRSRNVARHAINYTKNILNYSTAKRKMVSVYLIDEFFNKEGIDKLGLTTYDKDFMRTIIKSPKKKIGINVISKIIGVDLKTVTEEIEPFLLRSGYISISHGGREITKKGLSACQI